MAKIIELNPIRHASFAIWWYLANDAVENAEALNYLAGLNMLALGAIHVENGAKLQSKGEAFIEPEMNLQELYRFNAKRIYQSGLIEIVDTCVVAAVDGLPGVVREPSPGERCGRLLTTLDANRGLITEDYFKAIHEYYAGLKGDKMESVRSSLVRSMH